MREVVVEQSARDPAGEGFGRRSVLLEVHFRELSGRLVSVFLSRERRDCLQAPLIMRDQSSDKVR